MKELYENLLVAIEKMGTMFTDERHKIEYPNGYTLYVGQSCVILYDVPPNILERAKELISLYDHITHRVGSEIKRNTIRSSVRKYLIPSVNNDTRYSSIDKIEYFNLSMINGNIPTYEHIQFAFELRKLFKNNNRTYKSITVHPKFIDLEKLKNTEILFC